jgi:ribonucleoside-diphosphate reductase alpha chain
MRSNQFCNLSEVVIRADDTEDVLKEKVRKATILGTMQASLTDFGYLRSAWKEASEDEALLGVSLTGIMDNPLTSGALGRDKLADVLDGMRLLAVETNREWAEVLGINPAAAVTCVKPSGTVSQLVDCASGIHPRFSPHYIRRVRADQKDPMAQMMKEDGFPFEPDAQSPKHNWVFSFPMRSPENALCADKVPALKQLELWETFHEHWCEHKPSATIYIQEHEWMDVGAWVYGHFDSLSGVAFLPYSGHGYRQPPYQECSEEEFEKLQSKMPENVDWSRLQEFEMEDETTGSQEYACAGDKCEVVDLVKS